MGRPFGRGGAADFLWREAEKGWKKVHSGGFHFGPKYGIIYAMSENWKDKFARWFTIVLVTGILVGGLALVWPVYQRSCALRKQDEEMQERIDEKKQEIASLLEKQKRFRADPDFVEQIARQNRRVFPGELVFVFEKEGDERE